MPTEAAAFALGRELRALEDSGQAHPKAVKRLVTLTRDAVPTQIPEGVVAQPAYEWLLNAESTHAGS
jgi:hypothetical protein